jgi:hypothetical protein
MQLPITTASLAGSHLFSSAVRLSVDSVDCRVLNHLSALIFGHGQSFQQRTLRPVHLGLGPGTSRYDSLTWSDSPPSSESFTHSSVTLGTTNDGQTQTPDGCTVPGCTACSAQCLGALSMHCSP